MNYEKLKLFYKELFFSISKSESNKYFFYHLIKPNNFNLILDGLNLKNLEVKYDFIEENKINNFFFNTQNWQVSIYSKFFNSSYGNTSLFPEVTQDKKELTFEYELLLDYEIEPFLSDSGTNGWLQNEDFDSFFEKNFIGGNKADL